MTDKPCVLLAEDDEGHATLIRRSLSRSGLDSVTVRLKDGQELLDYLYRRASWTDREPHEAMAIITDLKMPRLGGFEVLQHLKGDSILARIPVLVLTTTDNPVEIDRCYALGAAAYVVKPVDYGKFAETVRRVAEFLTAIQLPGEPSVSDKGHGG